MVTVVHGNIHLSLGERRRELHDAYVMYSIQYGVYEYAWSGTEEPVHWFDIGLMIALILSGVWGCSSGAGPRHAVAHRAGSCFGPCYTWVS